MKCRARMIDGSPVTFRRIDLGAMHELDGGRDGYTSDKVFAERWTYHRAVHVTDFEGEGFNVRSVWPDYKAARAHSQRMDADRACLENAGVDTATVEYWAPETIRTAGDHEFRYLGTWEPLFPPVVKQPWKVGWGDAGGKPGGIIYTEDEVTSLRSMLDAERRMNKELSERLAAKVLDKAFSDATKMPGRMIYVGAEGLVTEAMLEAGWAAMRASPLYGEPAKTLEMIWRAMEKARTK